jgi:hypothetical protein
MTLTSTRKVFIVSTSHFVSHLRSTQPSHHALLRETLLHANECQPRDPLTLATH